MNRLMLFLVLIVVSVGLCYVEYRGWQERAAGSWSFGFWDAFCVLVVGYGMYWSYKEWQSAKRGGQG